MTIKARHILTGEVEDAGGVLKLGLINCEDAAEGGDLIPRHLAVGLGDLGPQRDDGDGEADGQFGVVVDLALKFVEDNGKRLALGECRQRFGDAGPD